MNTTDYDNDPIFYEKKSFDKEYNRDDSDSGESNELYHARMQEQSKRVWENVNYNSK